MTVSSPRSVRPLRFLSSLLARNHFAGAVLLLLMTMGLATAANAAEVPTDTVLKISPAPLPGVPFASVPYKTPITLTATVTANGEPVSAGLVLFCDATAAKCENNSALGVAQLTATGATAVVKLGSGPIGSHSYKAVFRENNAYMTSTSNTVTYVVTGTYPSTTSLSSAGAPGNYSLTSVIAGVGSLTTGPTGSIAFQDTSVGNNPLGSESLVLSSLSDTFLQSTPFEIGGPSATTRSVAIASAYLDGDDNLDVVTGDAAQTITVLLGNGDGTFKSNLTYPGCTVGVATKILLADFNRDGNTDIALGCSYSDGKNTYTGGLVIILGKGDGTFLAPVTHTTGDVAGVAIGDFNGDGLLDIAVTNQNQQNVTIFLGNGKGAFTAQATTVSTPAQVHGLVVADFNQDKKDDLAYAVSSATSTSLSDLYVALGNGDGTFNTPTLARSKIGEFLTSGDTNGDNLTDIVSSTVTGNFPANGPYTSNSLFVLLGNGDGTFQPTATYLSDIPSDPHLADVNGDGVPDIIAGGSFGALVYQGNVVAATDTVPAHGDGTFQAYQEPKIGGFALTYAVNAGDYNNDGNADLIGTDAKSAAAAISLSQVTQTSNASALTGVAVLPQGSGVHNVDAVYSGDTIYIGSTSTTTPLTAQPAPTTLVLTVSPTSATLSGQSVTLTATLSPYTVGPPTTTTDKDVVTFSSGGAPIGTGSLSKGVATLTTTSLPVGGNSLTANFPGDPNYDPSSSGTLSVLVSNVLVSSSLNPSTYSQSVTFTGTVASGSSGVITFKEGATTLGSGTISGTTATFTTSTLSVNIHDITALFNGVTSPILEQVVNKATPTVTVASSLNPSPLNQSVTFTTTVTSGATGTVTFIDGTTTLGTGTISGGVATFTTSSLTLGSHSISASYGGDTNYTTATSLPLAQGIVKITPTVTLISSLNPSILNQSVTFTTTVTSGATGTVTFLDGSTALGTGTISGGTATFTTSSLAIGTHTITANYGGDSSYATTTSLPLSQVVNRITSTVSLVSSLNPSKFNQSVTFTATVTSGATGTVTYFDGTTKLGTGTISGGTATFSTSTLTAGTHSITASYGGDTSYSTSTSSAVSQVVNQIAPTVSLVSSPNPSTFNQSVTFTATVTSGATGTVTFLDGTATLGTGTISGSTATFSTSTLSVGTHIVTANYGGDTNYTTATSSSVSQVVNKATSTVGLTSSLNPSTFNQSVTFTATVTSGGTGTVTFLDGTTTLGTGTVSGGTATFSTSTLAVGTHSITANYGGDTNYGSSTSAALSQVVNKAVSTVTVVSSVNPSTLNQSVTFTATVTSGATGTVTFLDGTTTLGTGTVSGGSATFSTSTLTVGTHSITVSYGGDTSYATSTSSALSQVVNKLTATISIVSSVNPSTFNQSVTFTATVTSAATGTVTFLDGTTTLGTSEVSGGKAAFSLSTLTIGTHTITATYNGDSTYGAVTSSPLSQVVNKAAPTVGLTSSLNPSTFGQSVTFTATVSSGATGSVTFLDGTTTLGTGTISSGTASFGTSSLNVGTHTITASYGGDSSNGPVTSAALTQTVNKATPVLPIPIVSTTSPVVGTPVTITETVPPGVSGPVTFYNGTTPIGTSTIVDGVATITVTALPLGTDQITATTPGDANNNPATSPAVSVTVVKTAPTISITSSLNPSVFNQSVTFTAIAPTGATGTITFLDGTTVLGTGTLNNAQATFTTSTLAVGSHTITASYIGDTNNSAATSVPLTQFVNKATPILPPPGVSSANPTVGSPETITEAVPTGVSGPVTFYNGGVSIGSAPIVNGVATITTSTLPVGSDPITASTPGDANNNPATSPATIVTVGKATPVLPPPTVSSSDPAPNTPVTISETIPPGVSGPVTIYDGTIVLGTAPIINGVATITVPSLPIGPNSITASTPGDANNNPATSPSVTVTVAKAAATVTLASSTNPAASGAAVTFTATVHAGATGSVTFLDGTTILGTGVINTAGVATFTTSTLSIGSHPITATFAGDTNYSGATSAGLMEVISKIPTTVTLGESSPAQLFNSVVTFTATVTAPTPTPTGTVTFLDGTTVLGTAPLSTNGTVIITFSNTGNAAFVTSALTSGMHQITAVYSGDNTFLTSTSAPDNDVVEDFTNANSGAASQTVAQGASTTYKFALTPLMASTFLNDVKLTVSGLPTGATYTFAPASITAGSAATTVVLTVQTSKPASTTAGNRTPQNGPASHREMPIALGMLGLAGLGTIRRLRRKMPRSLLLLLLAIGSLLPIAALSGCAGGYFTPNDAQSYPITVTGIEGSIQHTATATLIVQ